MTDSPRKAAALDADQILRQAVELHRAGQLEEGGKLYQAILQVYPEHADANHNLGVLAVQMQQAEAGLPYLATALDADPSRGQYWLSYIDALFQAGQPEVAREVLALAREQGLQGEEVDVLARRLEGEQPAAGQTDAEVAYAGKPAANRENEPGSQEINTLAELYNQRRYGEAILLAQTMTMRYPRNEFGWKILGATLKQLGRGADALAPMQQAVALCSEDADAHCNLAVVLLDLGRLDEAEVANRRVLQLTPGSVLAHSNLGVTLQAQGRLNEAEASFRRALQINPDYAKAYFNLGCLLYSLKRHAEAETNLRQAIKCNPDYVKAYSNLGATLYDLGRLEEAETCYRRALQIDPDFAEAYYNLGNIFKDLGLLNEAEASYRRALQINPGYADAHSNLGFTLQRQGRLEEALACFQERVRLLPGDGVALHQVAALSGSTTECAPVEYVENVFDGYANKFDKHLLQDLNYAAPEKLAKLVAQFSSPSIEKWNVLDLGCGTGLVGAAIAPLARQLVGVDLSSKMLEKAAARGIYRRLERQNLLTMMLAEKTSSYDVVFSADVFIYIGRIDEIVAEVKRLLVPGGLFAFSIETLETLTDEETDQGVQGDFRLEQTGRYSQSLGYLSRLATANGFLPQQMMATPIRTEQGKPVNGHLILWKS